MFIWYKNPKQNLCFFSFCFFVLFSMVRVHAKAGPWGRPHAAYPIGPFQRTFLRCKKSHSWGILHILVLYKRVRKRFRKKCKIFGTGSRRGATPGRLAAQNRWFLKGFLPEGRLHRTCGRDHLGAWSLLQKSQEVPDDDDDDEIGLCGSFLLSSFRLSLVKFRRPTDDFY